MTRQPPPSDRPPHGAAGIGPRRDYGIPPHAPGMRIGLFGGTFDPPHEAHLGACLLAMRRLNLDRVWWLVTPGNPLKDTRNLAPLADRIAAARRLARHPRIMVSGLEAAIGARYTYDTIAYLVSRCPGVRFVWIMGADNLRSFHRWRHWREIAALVPIVVVDRLGPSLYSSAGVAGRALSYARLHEHEAKTLLSRRPPAWVFLHGLKSPLSSTALRALRHAQGHQEAPARAARPPPVGADGAAHRGDGAGESGGSPRSIGTGEGGPGMPEPAASVAAAPRQPRKLQRGT